MADDSIVGAWELVSDSRVGVSIYTDSHFSTVMAAKNRQRSSGERATPERPLRPRLPARPYPAPTPSLDQPAPTPEWPTPAWKGQPSLSLVITP